MKFYKFRPDNEYTKDMLRNSQLYLAQPSQLNDPFDCRSNAYFEGSYDEWKRYLLDYGKTEELACLMANSYKDRIIEPNEKIDDDVVKICCFTINPNNTLMWSHYANDHKGICIIYELYEFDSIASISLDRSIDQIDDQILRNKLVLKKVNYLNTPVQPINKLKNQAVTHFYISKSEEWKYEDEYRIIIGQTIVLKNPITIERNQIKGIILGMKMNSDKRNEYIDLSKKHYIDKGFDFKIYNAYTMKNDYNLYLNELRL